MRLWKCNFASCFCFFQALIFYIALAVFVVWIYLKYFGAFYKNGFTTVALDKAKQLFEEGGTLVAFHPNDFIKGFPEGTIHITCLVPSEDALIEMAANAKVFNF